MKVTKQVTISDTGFTPDTLSINVGDTVRFTNTGVSSHNVTFAAPPVARRAVPPDFNPATLGRGGASAQPPAPQPDPAKVVAAPPASPDVAKGGTFDQVFDTAGTYHYGCGLHPEMKGVIVVS